MMHAGLVELQSSSIPSVGLPPPAAYTLYMCDTFSMAAVYRPLCLQGQRINHIIDDAVGVAADQPTGQFYEGTSNMLLTALGFTISLHKCSLPQSHSVRYRRMMVDSQQAICTVPQDKLGEFVQRAEQLLQHGTVAVTDMLSLAGTLVSFQPAMPYVMMQTRAFIETVQQGQPTHGSVQLPAHLRQDIIWWLHQMQAANGRCFWATVSSSVVASNASETAYAAYTVSGQPRCFVLEQPFTAEKRRRTAQHELTAIFPALQRLV